LAQFGDIDGAGTRPGGSVQAFGRKGDECRGDLIGLLVHPVDQDLGLGHEYVPSRVRVLEPVPFGDLDPHLGQRAVSLAGLDPLVLTP
jgi:hypothetical protein